MNALALVLLLLVPQQVPRNDPNGRWVATSGTEYDIQMVGAELQVRIVPGTNPTYLEYAVTLKNTDDPNSYQGTGHFRARLEGGKECEFETTWEAIVVSDDRILGATSQVVPDPQTCEIVESGTAPLDLQRR